MKEFEFDLELFLGYVMARYIINFLWYLEVDKTTKENNKTTQKQRQKSHDKKSWKAKIRLVTSDCLSEILETLYTKPTREHACLVGG